MKIKCDECGKEINWWETTGSEGKLITCPCCDTENGGDKHETCDRSTIDETC